MISLSPLPSAHPNPFQRILVRTSIACYGDFILSKGRSLGFASACANYNALVRLAFASAPVPEGLNLADATQLVGSLCKRHAVADFSAPTACKRTVSGSISLPCSGFFSPFLHSTGPLSVFNSYLALRDGPRGFRQDSSCPALLRWPAALARLPVPDCHCLRCVFPDTSGSLAFTFASSYNPVAASTTTVWALSFSLATTLEIDAFFLFLQVLRCFSSLRWLKLSLVCRLHLHGLPHSDICGSIPVCSSPQLFAAYHVLHRRLKP